MNEPGQNTKCDRWCDMRHDAAEELLKTHLQRIDTRLDESDKRVILAKDNIEQRLEQLNELRKQVTEDRNDFLRTTEYSVNHRALEQMIGQLSDRMNVMANRLTAIETRSVTWTLALGLAFAVFQIILHFWSLNVK